MLEVMKDEFAKTAFHLIRYSKKEEARVQRIISTQGLRAEVHYSRWDQDYKNGKKHVATKMLPYKQMKPCD